MSEASSDAGSNIPGGDVPSGQGSARATGVFLDFVSSAAPAVEQALLELLPPVTTAPMRLHAAMHHAMFPGGKRLRPMLTLLGCLSTGGERAAAVRPAAAVECLHTYSLVHDDLPCMDDDDLRRGRPTCHKVYGEALALLAGDALLTLAFEGAASGGSAAVAALARAAGSLGMVGGQVEDLLAEGEADGQTLARVQWIHDRKTGALITASLLVGAHAGSTGLLPAEVIRPLADYGDRLGRAFQIADDCLDLTGSASELGKNPGADVALGKLTWPRLVGVENSLSTASSLAEEAASLALEVVSAASDWRGVARSTLDGAARLLQDVAFYAVERRR